MSLIHEALKKLEGRRLGYGEPASKPLPSRKNGSSRHVPAILPLLLVAALLSAFLFARYYRTKRTAQGMPAKAGQSDAAGRQVGEAVKSAEAATPWAGHNAKGVEHYRAGRLKDAIVEFEKGASSGPGATDKAALLNNAAVAHMSLGDAAKALRLLKQATSLRPGYAEAVNNMGAVMQKKGRLDDAEAYFKKASELRPDYADARLNRASALERIGLYKEALSEYEKYLVIEGDGADSEKIAKRAWRIRRGLISGAYTKGR
ncbi:MAG: tetratricopeptide repeat protein [Deltaproteobacteria bacterium]|nr:tetratricopeptide repeat protein [Deltaproteobacteria bacterium]